MQDSDYVARLNLKTSKLEHYEVRTRQEITQTNTELVRTSSDIKLEIEELRSELSMLQTEIKHTVDKIKGGVEEFRKVVKKGDFARLQARIDAWSPEQRVTREQFARMLRDSAEDF